MSKELVPTATSEVSRGKLIRYLLTFQVKLAIDGLKDMVLAPISLVAGLIGIVFGTDRLGPLRLVLRMGRSFDEYVDLYSAIEKIDDEKSSRPPANKPGKLDHHLLKVEQALDNASKSSIG